jgi:hypothetical protein
MDLIAEDCEAMAGLAEGFCERDYYPLSAAKPVKCGHDFLPIKTPVPL